MGCNKREIEYGIGCPPEITIELWDLLPTMVHKAAALELIARGDLVLVPDSDRLALHELFACQNRRRAKKRRGGGFGFTPEMRDLEKAGCCPVCGTHRLKWRSDRQSPCCSPECEGELFDHCHYETWGNARKKAAMAADYRCQWCGKDLVKNTEDRNRCQYPADSGDVDHIVPIALGGSEVDPENLQYLCKECHDIKTSRDKRKIAELRRAPLIGIITNE